MAKGGAYGTKTVVLIVGGILLLGGIIAVIVLWATGKFNHATVFTQLAPPSVQGHSTPPRAIMQDMVPSFNVDSAGVLTMDTFNPLNEQLSFTVSILRANMPYSAVFVGNNNGGKQTMTVNLADYAEQNNGNFNSNCENILNISSFTASRTGWIVNSGSIWSKDIGKNYCLTGLK
jgi:hypothetical protein